MNHAPQTDQFENECLSVHCEILAWQCAADLGAGVESRVEVAYGRGEVFRKVTGRGAFNAAVGIGLNPAHLETALATSKATVLALVEPVEDQHNPMQSESTLPFGAWGSFSLPCLTFLSDCRWRVLSRMDNVDPKGRLWQMVLVGQAND